MARRTLNRRELREAHEAAERSGAAAPAAAEPAAKKPPARRKSRAKEPKEVRLKAFWAVYSQSMTPVVTFEYSQRAEADKKAAELSESKKTPHFVGLLKKVIDE